MAKLGHLVLAAAFSLVACGDHGDASPPPPDEGDAASADGGLDASTDAGPSMDASVGMDAANDADAAVPSDAGNEPGDATSLDGTVGWDATPADAEPALDGSSGTDGAISGEDGGVPLVACTSVTSSGDVLLDLGQEGVSVLEASNERLLSVGSLYNGWLLWNATTGARIAKGSSPCIRNQGVCVRATLRGNLFLVPGPTSLEIRDTNDGHVVGTVPLSAGQFGLAADGSFVWSATATEVAAWTPTGSLKAMKAGNYAPSKIAADVSSLRIALGPAGNDVIERLDVATSASALSAPFLGAFSSWFSDGARFLTATGVPGATDTTVRVYSSDAVVQKLIALSSTVGAPGGGYGDFFWMARSPGEVRVFSVSGGDSPVFARSLNFGSVSSPTIAFSSSYLTVLNSTVSPDDPSGYVGMIDLRDTTPTLREFRVPAAPAAVAANASGDWFAASNGAIFADFSGNRRTFGCGAALALTITAGGTWAVSVSASQVLVGNLSERRIDNVIPFRATQLALTPDAAALVVAGQQVTGDSLGGKSLQVYDLATNSVRRRVDIDGQAAFDVSLSQAGTRVGLTMCGLTQCNHTVTDLLGSTTYFSSSSSVSSARGRLALAPTSSHLALGTTAFPPAATTNIYEDSVLAGAADGVLAGWVTDDRLLLNLYGLSPAIGGYAFTGAVLVDPQGRVVARPSWPALGELQNRQIIPLSGGTRLYSSGTIYDVATSANVWSLGFTEAFPNSANDTVVLYASGSQVLTTAHP